MKQCIIADFEWCVTPHPMGDHFQYFNEILSAGAVRIDETGTVLERFYTLIRPENAAYLHPVILTSLRLNREALAQAVSFSEAFDAFLAFVGSTRVFTWGCADRSAVLQNLRIKVGCSADKAAAVTPVMRDLQPTLSRGAGISPPYPSLAAVLSALKIENTNRHNAMADAEDTARIVSALYRQDPSSVAPLFEGADTAPAGPEPEIGTADTGNAEACKTPGEALNRARRQRVRCPDCGEPAGIGTWIRVSKTEMMTLCSCEADGRFLCAVSAAEAAGGGFVSATVLQPFTEPHKSKYEQARRAARMRRMQVRRPTDDECQQDSANKNDKT